MLNYCANGSAGYNLTRSLRFRSSASASLSRTFGTPTSGTTWTMSFWFKRGALGVGQELFAKGNTSTQPWTFFYIDANGALNYYEYNTSNGNNVNINTTPLYRDPSAWYHIMVVVDSTQATASNRIKFYVNGSQVTALGTASTIGQNTSTVWNSSGGTSYFGRQGGGDYLDGYLTEINFIDGQALTPSFFGSTNSLTGVWQPAKYTGTYGTNGFYLPFSLNSTSTYAGSFNGSSQYLTTPSSSAFAYASNSFTLEGWLYLNSAPSTDAGFIDCRPASTAGAYVSIFINSSRQPFIFSNSSTTITGSALNLNQWNHIAYVRNGTTGTLYVNGVSQGSATDTVNYLSTTTTIGRHTYGGALINGYISNVRVVNGTAVYTSAFTPPSSPLTAITNTQLLTLQNSTIIDNSTNAFTITNTGSVTTSVQYPFTSNIAADASGNNNNWTPNNISLISGTTYDSMTDVPTLTSATAANYPTLNPLSNTSTLTEANLSASNILLAGTTMATPSTGKWYFEYTQTTSIPSGSLWVGISSNLNAIPDNQLQGYSYATDGRKVAYNSYTSGYGATWTNGDVIGCALDLDNQTITFYKNGVSQGTAFTGITAQPYVFALSAGGVASTKGGSINCGQRPFSYTPPTGYVALNTYNLPTSTIVKGNTVMDATLYTGNGVNATSITNAAPFKPDLVWIKKRNSATSSNHYWTDSVRGVGNTIFSNLTTQETFGSDRVQSFNSNGFTIGTDTNVNNNGDTYVGWQWQAGQGTTSSNTNGSITSTVSVNTTAGFSVVTYTGNGTTATIGHSLGVAPKMIIVKKRNAVANWSVYHASVGATQVCELNTTNAFSASGQWGNTSPTSTVFTHSADNAINWVAYCWAEIAGFSKFGSYTGNGSTDGTFIYTGFLPRYILIKASSFGGTNSDWYIYDTARNTYNTPGNFLCADLSQAEASGVAIDCLANGFKIRGTGAGTNTNGATYIYAAFSSNPLKNSNAF